jgi:Neuraminidase (sialidase)
MTKAELTAKMEENSAWLPGKTVKLDFGDEGTILMDGKNNTVTEDSGAADTTIRISWDDWQAMARVSSTA